MDATPLILEAKRISRRHPDGRPSLLDDVSLAIRGGVRLAVVGDSGSGKTLLLRAMGLLDALDRGEILWKGRAIAPAMVPRFRRQVLYLHQRPVLLGETVENALRQPFTLAAHRGRSFDRMRLLEALASVDRDASFFSKRAGELSGGEIQLTALLRAIQLEPAVLLLDEPTASLDPKTTHSAEKLLVQWVNQRPEERALAWVTHDEAQAGRVAQRVLRMQAGRLEEV